MVGQLVVFVLLIGWVTYWLAGWLIGLFDWLIG